MESHGAQQAPGQISVRDNRYSRQLRVGRKQPRDSRQSEDQRWRHKGVRRVSNYAGSGSSEHAEIQEPMDAQRNRVCDRARSGSTGGYEDGARDNSENHDGKEQNSEADVQTGGRMRHSPAPSRYIETGKQDNGRPMQDLNRSTPTQRTTRRVTHQAKNGLRGVAALGKIISSAPRRSRRTLSRHWRGVSFRPPSTARVRFPCNRHMRFVSRSVAVLIFGGLCFAATDARSHPHEFIVAEADIHFNADGAVVAIDNRWLFDESFTAFALEGIDTNGDGQYSPEELKSLADTSIESIADFHFFTFASAGDKEAGFAAPTDYQMTLKGNRLALRFALPLKQPLPVTGRIAIEVYDPEYYIAFKVPDEAAVRLVDAPSACRFSVRPAVGPSAQAASLLAGIAADIRELSPEMKRLTAGIENRIEINCGGPDSTTAKGDGFGAEEQTDLRARSGLLPDTVAAESGGAAIGGSPVPATRTDLMRWIPEPLAEFAGALRHALKGLAANGSLSWWLGGASFLYGAARGGRAIQSFSQTPNGDASMRRALASSALAFVQAFAAITIVGMIAFVLNSVRVAGTGLVEKGSLIVVAVLGFALFVQAGRKAIAAIRGYAGLRRHLRKAPARTRRPPI